MNANRDIIINVKELYKSFNNTRAVDGLSMKIMKGEIFGLLGPNGAGKTTTIRLLTGLLEPDGGDIIINGVSLKRDKFKVRNMIGLCPQEISLVDFLTGKENAIFFGTIRGLSGKILNERVNYLLDKFGLTNSKKKTVKNYSGGMKRRLNLIAALIGDPPILFLDEPTVGLDPQSRRVTWDFIKSFKGKKTIVLTTHYIEEAEALCDRVGIIDHGQIIALGSPDELKMQMPSTDEVEIILLNKNGLNSIIIEDLKKLDFVVNIFIDPDTPSIQISLKNGIKHLGMLLDKIPAEFIKDIKIQHNDLEKLFIHLTGREIRAET
ncbi:MAG: ABC transporter ATP-binding protein [Promethearchaeota archaeon]